ncbi:rab-GTPase-TBC domain-containing protein [Scenedesmus sp. NREL 46B-D3]|nr:rab-GTPase-TBC domain-containing protein [Scenedesmus sp. NREL 46B-D3]KAF6253135.1 rab-GTPase-TBC domain-containing protein [Scenedesmus sp. NREL 46B-D3]
MQLAQQPAQQLQLDATGQGQQQQRMAGEVQQQPAQQFERNEAQQQQLQRNGAHQQQEQQPKQQAEQHAQIQLLQQQQQQQRRQAPGQLQCIPEQQQEPARDVYGFSLAGLTEQQLAARAACAAYEARRSAKWQPYADKGQLPGGAVLKRFCRKGVPHQLRGWVWWQTSGAARAAAAAPSGPARTFPRHPWLAQPEGQAALRCVLTAYAGHNQGVGYCQGMNFLAGLLLLAVDKDCTKTFWLLVVLLDKVLYPGTYARNLDGCHVEMGCLSQLLQQKQPTLAEHMQALGCEASLLATDWYLCLFSTSLPAETAARVWDCLLLEGRKVLHRLGLALLDKAAPQLMQLDNAGEVLRSMKQFAAGCHDRGELMATAFNGIGGLPRARIAKIQEAEEKRVSAMLAARVAKQSKATH